MSEQNSNGWIPLGPHAAVVPLDYGERSAAAVALGLSKQRVENSVIYFDDNWNELVSILQAPVEYFVSRQAMWRQERDHHIHWRLRPPLTAVLKHWKSTPVGYFKFASMVPELQSALAQKNSSFDGRESLFAAIEEVLADFFPYGAFLVEFAVDGGLLTIEYFPPRFPTLPPPRPCSVPQEGPFPERYQGGYTPATLVLHPGPEFSDLGPTHAVTLHFDLGNEARPPEDRANFVVQWLENSAHTCAVLSSRDTAVITADLRRINSELPHITDARSQRLSFRGNPGGTGAPGSVSSGHGTTYPTVVVEGLAADTNCPVCVVGSGQADGVEVVINGVTVKEYCPPSSP